MSHGGFFWHACPLSTGNDSGTVSRSGVMFVNRITPLRWKLLCYETAILKICNNPNTTTKG